MKENFPKRNRIVAGICDSLIVVESGIKGGSLITAEIANSYNKDIYALPGKITDTWSIGCNTLISQNKAAIISNIDQLLFNLGYNINKKTPKKQLELPLHLSENEQKVYEYLKAGEQSIDNIHLATNIPVSQLALILLDLEFQGYLYNAPGKVYGLKK